MTHEEKFNYITSLGWTKLDDWNDREIYSLVYDGESLGQLIVHNGNWSIPRGNDLYYIENPSIEVIKEYTNILKALITAIKENITPRNKHLMSIALSEASRSVKYWKVK